MPWPAVLPDEDNPKHSRRTALQRARGNVLQYRPTPQVYGRSSYPDRGAPHATRPHTLSPAMQACIDACNACAQACDFCAASCLQEADVTAMAACIRSDIDCAQICRLCAAFTARGRQHAAALCELCAQVCDACGAECARHDMEHCQACASACRACAEACRAMAAAH